MSTPSPLKLIPEVERLRVAAEALERVLADVATVVRAGISTSDIANVAALGLARHGLEGVLAGYRGYPAAVCTSVNNIAAHGIPGAYELAEGDLLTVDISADRGGWKADAAWTYGVGQVSSGSRRLLRAAWRCTLSGASAAVPGGHLGDIGAAIDTEARRHGCRVVREFTGHGIGRDLHEQPVVPHTGRSGTGSPIVPGMVLNVEPVLTLGDGSVTRLGDGWSYATSDGSLSAQFEVTVAVSECGPVILTLGRFGIPDLLRSAPYG